MSAQVYRHTRVEVVRRGLVAIGTLAALLSGVVFAQAGNFPDKPITILVWSSPGGKADTITRDIAPLLGKELGTNVVVKNVVGGGGTLAVDNLVSQPANGYTLLTASPTIAALYSEPGVHFTESEVQPVCVTSTVPFALMVPANSPFKNLKQFISYAKAHPGKLHVGGPFAVGSHRVQWVEFQRAAGIQATWIPFDGSKEADLAVAGGHVDAGTSTNPQDVKSLVQAGKVRVLAVSSAQPIAGIDAPTYEQDGINFTHLLWTALVTRSGLPQAVLQKLTNACFAAMRTPTWKTVENRMDTQVSFMQPSAIEKTIQDEAQTAAAIRKSLQK